MASRYCAESYPECIRGDHDGNEEETGIYHQVYYSVDHVPYLDRL